MQGGSADRSDCSVSPSLRSRNQVKDLPFCNMPWIYVAIKWGALYPLSKRSLPTRVTTGQSSLMIFNHLFSIFINSCDGRHKAFSRWQVLKRCPGRLFLAISSTFPSNFTGPVDRSMWHVALLSVLIWSQVIKY